MRVSRERGQATVEWVALLLLVAAALATVAALAGARTGWLPGALRCAIFRACGEAGALRAAYGPEVGELVRGQAPSVVYERGTFSLPVDFRRCRSHRCSDAPDRPGAVARSARGRVPASAFTRVVDRRDRGGDLFLQFWLYYPDSTYVTSRLAKALDHVDGGAYHRGDWESYQVRLSPAGGARARASAHAGYTGRRSRLDACETTLLPGFLRHLVDDCHAWIPTTGWTRVSRGSHAGHIVDGPGHERFTPAADLHLVPLEPLSRGPCRWRGSEVSAPWCKPVYRDPERDDT